MKLGYYFSAGERRKFKRKVKKKFKLVIARAKEGKIRIVPLLPVNMRTDSLFG